MFFKRSHTLNFDGAHNNQGNKGGAGCIIRDNDGELVVAAAYNLSKTDLPFYNVAIAEAVGLRNGLRLAKKHNLKLNLVHGDNKEVIDLVLGFTRRQPPPPLSGIIAEIKSLINLDITDVKLIGRDNNEVADMFASMGLSSLVTESVFMRQDIDNLPPKVVERINQEKLSRSVTKKRNDHGEGSSMARDIGVAGAAVAGVALLGWGALKLFSDDNSSTSSNSDDQLNKLSKAIQGVQKSWDYNNSSSKDLQETRISDRFTLQYFGSDRNQLQKARAGCIIKNKQGELVVAAAYNLDNQYPRCNIAIAEAIALKNGLKLAEDRDIKLGLIQGRNQEVRDRVLGKESRLTRSPVLGKFVQEIKDALYFDQGITDVENKLQLVDEDEIEVARELATVGGMLEEEAMIYERVQDLPLRVARKISYGSPC